MAPWNPLSSILVAIGLAVGLWGVAPAMAQTETPSDMQIFDSDCSKIPGGNAPIELISRLEGGMSVRNLEFTYYGKPLHQLTPEDFDTIHAIWLYCNTYEPEVADTAIDKLEAVVSDAKAARRDSLAWIEETKKKVDALKPGEKSIRQIHDMWQEMLNREFEMLKSDLDYLARYLTKQRQALYASPEQRQRTLVSPFDPGAPDVRDLGG